jgi:hypothetical protein
MGNCKDEGFEGGGAGAGALGVEGIETVGGGAGDAEVDAGGALGAGVANCSTVSCVVFIVFRSQWLHLAVLIPSGVAWPSRAEQSPLPA